MNQADSFFSSAVSKPQRDDGAAHGYKAARPIGAHEKGYCSAKRSNVPVYVLGVSVIVLVIVVVVYIVSSNPQQQYVNEMKTQKMAIAETERSRIGETAARACEAAHLESQYAGEIKARKAARSDVERKRKAEEDAHARALAAKKAREDKLLLDYRNLKQRLGEFPGANEHSTDEEMWSRELLKGLAGINSEYFGNSMRTYFDSVVSSAEALLAAIRQEEDLRQEAMETKKKLIERKRQAESGAALRVLIGLGQAAIGDKSGGRGNFVGGICDGALQGPQFKTAISELEISVSNAHQKVARAYAVYQDSAQIFEKRALRQAPE